MGSYQFSLCDGLILVSLFRDNLFDLLSLGCTFFSLVIISFKITSNLTSLWHPMTGAKLETHTFVLEWVRTIGQITNIPCLSDKVHKWGYPLNERHNFKICILLPAHGNNFALVFLRNLIFRSTDCSFLEWTCSGCTAQYLIYDIIVQSFVHNST